MESYIELRQKAKQLSKYAEEINSLFFDENDLPLETYRDRVIPDCEEIILLATELRIKYKIKNVIESESNSNK